MPRINMSMLAAQLRHSERIMDAYYKGLREAGIVVRQGEVELHTQEQRVIAEKLWKELTQGYTMTTSDKL